MLQKRLLLSLRKSLVAAAIAGTSIGLGAEAKLCAQETTSGVQILGFSTANELSEDVQASLAEGAASFSFSSGPGAFSMGSAFGGVNPNDRSQLFGLLENESVREELKLTEQQYAGVKQIMSASQKNLQSAIKEMIGQSKGGAIRIGGDTMKAVVAENQEQAEAAIEEILLPEQMKRVQQLAYQIEVSKQGLGECLVNGQLGEEIGVHDDQKQHLTDVADRVAAETAAKIAAIRAQAMQEVLAELAPEQRKKAEDLLGEYFQYKSLSLEEKLQKSIKNLRAKKETEKED